MKTLSNLAIIAFVVLGMSSNTAADVEDILKAHFEAVGGLEQLSKIRTVKRFGNAQVTQFSGQPMNMPGTIEVAVALGEKSYVKSHFEWFSEAIIWNGTEGWKSTLHDGTVSLSALELAIAKNRTYLTPFHRSYEKHGSSAFQQSEDKMFQGKECSVIQITGVDSVKDVFYYIDKTSNLLVGIKVPNTDPIFNSPTVVIYCSDYTEYGGVMFPNSREVSIGNDELKVNYTYTKTEIDVVLDETTFEKP